MGIGRLVSGWWNVVFLWVVVGLRLDERLVGHHSFDQAGGALIRVVYTFLGGRSCSTEFA
jgi:hypothetical protein